MVAHFECTVILIHTRLHDIFANKSHCFGCCCGIVIILCVLSAYLAHFLSLSRRSFVHTCVLLLCFLVCCCGLRLGCAYFCVCDCPLCCPAFNANLFDSGLGKNPFGAMPADFPCPKPPPPKPPPPPPKAPPVPPP